MLSFLFGYLLGRSAAPRVIDAESIRREHKSAWRRLANKRAELSRINKSRDDLANLIEAWCNGVLEEALGEHGFSWVMKRLRRPRGMELTIYNADGRSVLRVPTPAFVNAHQEMLASVLVEAGLDNPMPEDILGH